MNIDSSNFQRLQQTGNTIVIALKLSRKHASICKIK
jgi:hypothetical protein